MVPGFADESRCSMKSIADRRCARIRTPCDLMWCTWWDVTKSQRTQVEKLLNRSSIFCVASVSAGRLLSKMLLRLLRERVCVWWFLLKRPFEGSGKTGTLFRLLQPFYTALIVNSCKPTVVQIFKSRTYKQTLIQQIKASGGGSDRRCSQADFLSTHDTVTQIGVCAKHTKKQKTKKPGASS